LPEEDFDMSEEKEKKEEKCCKVKKKASKWVWHITNSCLIICKTVPCRWTDMETYLFSVYFNV